ncbi:hypothetical protein M758_6G007000, partial [Ceratodon purpureus]
NFNFQWWSVAFGPAESHDANLQASTCTITSPQFPNCATYMRVVCMSAIPQIHFAKTARFTAVTFPSPCGATLWTSPITRTHSIIVNFLNYEPVFACGTQLPLLQRARTHAPVHNQPPSTC